MTSKIDMIDATVVLQARRMFRLFRGNKRTFGQFYPHRKKPNNLETIDGEVNEDRFVDHIIGTVGVGIVPITDDGECWFGAIDIDAHGDAPDIDLIELEQRVRELDLPLVVCRSKSGGAHLYLFMVEPTPAKLLRRTLAKWAGQLGFPGAEIFPKQETLKGREGGLMLGSWINICNFDVNSPLPLRYCFEGGQPVDFAHFLDIAESRMISAEVLAEKSDMQHAEAPPCVVRMLAGEVARGPRNESMFTVAVYMKRAFPNTWREGVRNANFRIFDTPLDADELKKLTDSIGRNDYQYKCKIDPCAKLCNSAECVKRKYGITPEFRSELELGGMPAFTNLRKVMTNPVSWLMAVADTDIKFSTPEIMDFKFVRTKIAESLSRIVPAIKNDKWHVILNGLMENAEIISAPYDATEEGAISEKLSEFINKADLHADPKDESMRQFVTSGHPVLTSIDDQLFVIFRGQDFLSYLKKTKFEHTTSQAVWPVVRTLGVEHKTIRIGQKTTTVWVYPLDPTEIVEFQMRDMEPEI